MIVTIRRGLDFLGAGCCTGVGIGSTGAGVGLGVGVGALETGGGDCGGIACGC